MIGYSRVGAVNGGAPGYGNPSSSGFAGNAARYNPISAPSFNALKQQQAAFDQERRRAMARNSWMAAPALAPPLVVAALMGAGALSAPLVLPRIARLSRTAPTIPIARRGGETAYTIAGRQAHKQIDAMVARKEELRVKKDDRLGWEANPRLVDKNGKVLIPDIRSPQRFYPWREEPIRHTIEAKPKTPSGMRAGKQAPKKYGPVSEGEKRVKAWFYDRDKLR